MGSCISSIQEVGPVVVKANDKSLVATRECTCEGSLSSSRRKDLPHSSPSDTAELTPASSGASIDTPTKQDDKGDERDDKDELVLDWLQAFKDGSEDFKNEVPLRSTRIEDVYDGVHDGPIMGEGNAGIVRQVTHKATGCKYAVKCLDLNEVTCEKELVQIRREISIMAELDHPNIARLEEVYESGADLSIVEELCHGKDLFDWVGEQPNDHLTEAECAKLIKQMLCAVSYLQSKGIVHRDLKLENCCFSSSTSSSVEPKMKLVDFGLSRHFKYGEVLHEPVGTPYTVAPEVLSCSYDEKCDIWSIGVITYLLLSGYPPFGGCGCPESLKTLRRNIRSGHFAYEPDVVLAGVSSQARHFVKALLEINPRYRPTAKEAANHPWLREDHGIEQGDCGEMCDC